jgi:hypothetical protein
MVSDDLRFFLLCAGEVAVVLVGLVYVPAALYFQLFLPLLVFHNRLFYRTLPFFAVFILGTVGIAVLLLYLGSVLLSVLILGAVASVSILAMLLIEARLQTQYGGVA